MEIRQLEYFLAVVTEMNFSRAAQRVHVVQSALSASVAKLEKELGVELSRPRIPNPARIFRSETCRTAHGLSRLHNPTGAELTAHIEGHSAVVKGMR